MMSFKEKKMLSKAKYNAYILKSNYQIPFCLYMAIVKMDENTSEERVKYLAFLVARYSRIKGFYNFNGDDSALANKQCEEDLKKV